MTDVRATISSEVAESPRIDLDDLPAFNSAPMPQWPDAPTPAQVNERMIWLSHELEAVSAGLALLDLILPTIKGEYQDALDAAKEDLAAESPTDRARKARIATAALRHRLEHATGRKAAYVRRNQSIRAQMELARTFAVDARAAYGAPVNPGPSRR